VQLGAWQSLSTLPGMVAFGLIVGATAADKGFHFIDSFLMNLLVFAGLSQLVAMEVWPSEITFATLAALALVTATVNARMMLMSASLRPWLGHLPALQTYPTLHLLTDPGWLIAMRYHGQGGRDAGVLLGTGLMMMATWLAASSAGFLLGTAISDTRQFGLDLVMPVFFATMLVPLWKGPRRGLAWVIAGVVALLFERYVGGFWYIVAGAAAGSVAGGLLHDRD
jgi:predicted branched-subunit amino acid permease